MGLPVPSYTKADLVDFERMVARVREGFHRRDPASIAAVATASALLNQRFLPMRNFSDIWAFARERRALGVQISHSGTIAGVLFNPREVPACGDVAKRLVEEVRSLGVHPLGMFTTGMPHIDAVDSTPLACR